MLKCYVPNSRSMNRSNKLPCKTTRAMQSNQKLIFAVLQTEKFFVIIYISLIYATSPCECNEKKQRGLLVEKCLWNLGRPYLIMCNDPINDLNDLFPSSQIKTKPWVRAQQNERQKCNYYRNNKHVRAIYLTQCDVWFNFNLITFIKLYAQ